MHLPLAKPQVWCVVKFKLLPKIKVLISKTKTVCMCVCVCAKR